jgi:hypothetical protein
MNDQTQELHQAWRDLAQSWGDLTHTVAQNSGGPSWLWQACMWGLLFWVVEFGLRIFIRKGHPWRQFTPLVAGGLAAYWMWLA